MPAFEIRSRCKRHPKHFCSNSNSCGSSNSMADVFSMSAEQLRTCIDMTETDENLDDTNLVEKPKLLVLDCRSFVSYNVGHIVDSINVHCPAILRRRSNGRLPLRTLLSNNNVRVLLTNGRCYPVILYDEYGSSPKRPTSAVSTEQLSTVEFVAQCLQLEAGIKSVFFLESGYHNFNRAYPQLCTPSTGPPTSPNAASPTILSCPVFGRPTSRGAGLPLSSKTLREHRQYGDADHGPVEILPHLWLGSASDASRPQLLKQLGITALLNVSRSDCCPDLFQDEALKSLRYKSIPLRDTPCQVIDCFFQEAFDFIDEAKCSQGKVLVHCRAGISRSATICIAYLMASRRLRMEDAYEHVKSRRRIVSPNFNFMGQLLAFERQLFSPTTSSSSSSRCPISPRSPASRGSPLSPSPHNQRFDTKGNNGVVFDFSEVSPSAVDQLVLTPI